MTTWIVLLTAIPPILSRFLLLGPKTTRYPRWLTAAGCWVPLLGGLIGGLVIDLDTALRIVLPLGIVIVGVGGLWFSNLPEPIPEAKKVYGLVLGSLGALSVAGWLLLA